jgi:twitching motility protein PilJ
MSFLDKIKPASEGTQPQDGRDSVYEAVHLDTQGQDGQSSVLPTEAPATTGFAEVGGNTTAYSTMEPLPSAAAAPRLRRQSLYTWLIVGGFAGAVLTVAANAWLANRNATQVGRTGQALMESQRLAKSTSTAMVGNSASFKELTESLGVLTGVTRGLRDGSDDLAKAASSEVQEALTKATPMVDRAEKNAVKVVLGQQKVLTQVGQSLRTINRQSSDLLEAAESVSSHEAEAGAGIGRGVGHRPAGDADPAHRQERQRVPDYRRV